MADEVSLPVTAHVDQTDGGPGPRAHAGGEAPRAHLGAELGLDEERMEALIATIERLVRC